MYPNNDIQHDQKLYIRELQSAIRRLSRSHTAIPTLNPDGIYGSETAHAVGQYQRRFGLPITKEADAATWESLFTELRRLEASDPSTDPFPPAFLPALPMPTRERALPSSTNGCTICPTPLTMFPPCCRATNSVRTQPAPSRACRQDSAAADQRHRQFSDVARHFRHGGAADPLHR